MTPVPDVITSFFAALTGGDLDSALELCAPDAVWVIPGDPDLLPWAGEHRGRDAIRSFYALLSREAVAEYLRLGPVAATGDQGFVRGEFAYTFHRGGGRYAGAFVIVFTVRQGFITRYEMHEDSQGLARAFSGLG
ncbi:nuclear transport factor 2 family protein [Enemella evansiae]|uniref:nuclear transport factor 2 family protein n=1 Tax=Enemella evansiae TaxID=2016499 RepID=UPI001060C729|nr:nuclear transport factor 2 family protein [Enemella evansiae]TDO93556.1 hypothetical protein C8D81_1343 [Enemella evansiae]